MRRSPGHYPPAYYASIGIPDFVDPAGVYVMGGNSGADIPPHGDYNTTGGNPATRESAPDSDLPTVTTGGEITWYPSIPNELTDLTGGSHGPDVVNYPHNPDSDTGEPLQNLPYVPGVDDDIGIELYGGKTLKQRFIETLPEEVRAFYWGTSEWTVHHVYPQAMQGGALSRAQLNEFARLVLIPDAVKDEVDLFYKTWARENLWRVPRLTDKVPGWEGIFWKNITEVDAQELVALFRAKYGPDGHNFYIHAGAGPDKLAEAKEVYDKFDTPAKKSALLLGKAKWIAAALGKTGAAIGILAVVGDSVAMANAIAHPTPESENAWKQFERLYNTILTVEMSGGTVSKETLMHFVDAFNEYLVAIKTPDQTRNLIIQPMRTYVDLR